MGEAVPRGFPIACSPASAFEIDAAQSGRLQLAEWLTDPEHPLTSRVIANRVWQHLFGEGIVRTVDDFGFYGDRPSHPDLLDYLALQLIEQGGSIKHLIRLITNSRTYQLSSLANEDVISADPGNRLLTRHQRRRLDAESLRDSMMMASGRLNLSPRQGSLVQHRDILLNLAGNLHQPSRHRSIYLCYLRGSPPPELQAFDLPEFTSVTGRRDVSTVPQQSLHLFNNPFVVDQARYLADSISKYPVNEPARIVQLWRRTLGRDPDSQELDRALELLKRIPVDQALGESSWPVLTQALLLTNEFRYVD